MARYIKPTSRRTGFRKSLFKPLAVFFIALIAATGAIGASTFIQQEKASADITADMVCEGHNNIPFMDWAGPDGDAPIFGKNSITYTIYRFTQTDDFHFAFESKSTVNAGTEDVAGLLNVFVSLGEPGKYTTINERILGANLTTGEPEGEYNSGSRVTAYDRFGLSGLSWTRYNGEWRYPYVDICSDSDPKDLKLGVLYDGRLEPLTTYDGISDTKDIRTAQFGEGILANMGEGFLNTTANWIFTITKGIVAVAIALVNLSFSDFPEMLGLNDLIGSEDGIFTNIYKGIYQPFIGIVFVAVGLLMLYKGIVRREFRGALGMLFRSIALFIIGVIMFTLPMLFISLPNNVAVVLQSLIINTMSSSMASGSGICTTDGAASTAVETNPTAPTDVANAEESQDLLTQASSNMRSVVGCQLWSTFLIKPWSLGQFGADYNKLYADGYIPSGAYGETGKIVTDNDWMVGNAAVPVGNGEFINNWALFQISTGTNAHSPYAGSIDEGDATPAAGISPYTNGIANDWYRIVDALSNYNEKESEIQDSITASNNSDAIDTIRFSEPDLDKKPTEYWSTWVGGNSAQRIGIALTSILGAAAGLFTVVIFGFLSAIYSFGIILVMAFAPLFLLAGSWGNRGWDIFKSWAQLLLNLVVKRVMVGTLLVLNLVLLTTVLNMMADQDYFWGVAALALVSFMLFKFKDKLVDTVGGIFTFNFSNENLEGKASSMAGKLRGGVGKAKEGITNVGAASILGGIAAHRNGAGFGTGAASGFIKELKTQAYRQDNSAIRQALRVSETLGSGESATTICPGCGRPLFEYGENSASVMVRKSDDSKWHIDCAQEENGGQDNLGNEWDYQDIVLKGTNTIEKKKPTNRRVASHIDLIDNKELTLALDIKSGSGAKPGTIIGKALSQDLRNPETIPEIPEILKPFLDDQKANIDSLIRSGDPIAIDAVVYMYAQALVAYAYSLNEVSVGDYSTSPNSIGSEDEDIATVYQDMVKEFK